MWEGLWGLSTLIIYTSIFSTVGKSPHKHSYNPQTMNIDFITEQKQSCLFIGCAWCTVYIMVLGTHISTTAIYVWVHNANSSLIPYIRLEIWVLELITWALNIYCKVVYHNAPPLQIIKELHHESPDQNDNSKIQRQENIKPNKQIQPSIQPSCCNHLLMWYHVQSIC